MDLWPAIDLRGGRCVRLLQGDYDRETVFADDPVEQVRRFVDQGARRLHVVDLDGAKSGSPVQAELIARMVRAAGVPCQLGGGIRSLDTARAYADAGVSRLVVGSVAIEQQLLVCRVAVEGVRGGTAREQRIFAAFAIAATDGNIGSIERRQQGRHAFNVVLEVRIHDEQAFAHP